MPLDSHLNADHERGLIWHAALTSDLHHTDPDKFLMGTPAEVSKSMDRTWEVFPTPERIVSDILKFPKALKRIKEVKGAVVPEMDTRTGRRSTAHTRAATRPCRRATSSGSSSRRRRRARRRRLLRRHWWRWGAD